MATAAVTTNEFQDHINTVTSYKSITPDLLDSFTLQHWSAACWCMPHTLQRVFQKPENAEILERHLRVPDSNLEPNLLQIAISIAGHNRFTASDLKPEVLKATNRLQRHIFSFVRFLVRFVEEHPALVSIVFGHLSESPNFVCDANMGYLQRYATKDTDDRVSGTVFDKMTQGMDAVVMSNDLEYVASRSVDGHGGTFVTIAFSRMYRMALHTWKTGTALPERCTEWIKYAQLVLEITKKLINYKTIQFGRQKHIPGAVEFLLLVDAHCRSVGCTKMQEVKDILGKFYAILDPYNQIVPFYDTRLLAEPLSNQEIREGFTNDEGDFFPIAAREALCLRKLPPWYLALSWLADPVTKEALNKILEHNADTQVDEKEDCTHDLLTSLIQGRAILHPSVEIGLITDSKHAVILGQQTTCEFKQQEREVDDTTDADGDVEMGGPVYFESNEVPICFGIFATEDIPANEPLAHYGGRLYLRGTRSEDETNMYVQETHGYESKNNMTQFEIDARDLSSPAIYVNDFHGIDLSPNCEMRPTRVCGMNAVVLTTTRRVEVGDELVCAYGNSYYEQFKRTCGFDMTAVDEKEDEEMNSVEERRDVTSSRTGTKKRHLAVLLESENEELASDDEWTIIKPEPVPKKQRLE